MTIRSVLKVDGKPEPEAALIDGTPPREHREMFYFKCPQDGLRALTRRFRKYFVGP